MNLKVDVVARHVGKRLERRRRYLGMTKQQLAALACTHSKQIRRYEGGEGAMTASRLHQLATALAVSPDYFFEGLRRKPPLAPIAYCAGSRPSSALQREALVLLGAYQGLSERSRQHFLGLIKMLSEHPREGVALSRAQEDAAPSAMLASIRGRIRP